MLISRFARRRLAVPWYPFNLCLCCAAGLPVDDWIEKAKWPGHHDFMEEAGRTQNLICFFVSGSTKHMPFLSHHDLFFVSGPHHDFTEEASRTQIT